MVFKGIKVYHTLPLKGSIRSQNRITVKYIQYRSKNVRDLALQLKVGDVVGESNYGNTLVRLDRATRVRLAITNGTALDKEARLISIEDITAKWMFLGETGLFPRDILYLANGDSSGISDKVFESIMRSMNSYL